MGRTTYNSAILAYGSLVDDPGKGLEPNIMERVECITPAKVTTVGSKTSRTFRFLLSVIRAGEPMVYRRFFCVN
jgi:hypothetical protein